MAREFDVGSLLLQVENVRASLSVMSSGIDSFFGIGDQSYLELQALVFHIEKITEMHLRDIDNLIADLKESGAVEAQEVTA